MTKVPTQFGVMISAINNDNQFQNTLITEKEVKTICTQVILSRITAEYWIRNCVGRTEFIVCAIRSNRKQNVQGSPNKSAATCAIANLTGRQEDQITMRLVAIVNFSLHTTRCR